MLQRFVSGMVAILVCAAVSVAQCMKVSGGAVLHQGDTVTVAYTDTSKPNGTIVVTIDDGAFPNPTYTEVVIHLDGAGNGSFDWVVPGWATAHFNAPGCREVTRAIN